VKRAVKALEMLGIEPSFLFSDGGLDANWLDKHGIPTVTIGSGQAEIHTVKEYVRLDEFEKGCRLGVLIATLGS
jgi:tripeptide aminopeptidase